ncbi:MAG: class I SAM-dependent methyltransferase, partial [Dehalococcoidia bacterium]
MSTSGPWNTVEFVQRVAQLERANLRDLFPSEAWSLYRILPHCESVLDLGCGNGRMAAILQAISPRTYSIGVDSNATLVQRASQEYAGANARFVQADVFQFLDNGNEPFDCVMAWALLYALTNFKELLDGMIARASKWVLFDMRVANVEKTIADTALAYTQYGDVRAPYVIASFRDLLQHLKGHEAALASVEMTGYHFPPGPTCWVSDTLSQPAVLLVVLERRPQEHGPNQRSTEWYIKVP